MVALVGVAGTSAEAQLYCVGYLPAGNGNTCRESLAVNTSSFQGGAFAGSAWELERNVRNSARAWTQYGSSRLGYDYIGTTSATACGSGIKHVVMARPGMCTPTPTCNCSLPQHQWNCIGGRNIDCGSGFHVVEINNHPNIVNPNWNPVSVGYPGALQSTITHELGHSEINPNLQPQPLGHIFPSSSTNPDIMQNGGVGPGATGFGPQDITFAQAWVGSGIEYAERWQSSVWPHPSTFSWATTNTPLASQWGTLDLAHGFVANLRRTSYFVADTSGVTGVDIDQVGGSFAGPAIVTRRRPTVLYDPVNKNWWLASINADGTIAVFRSPNRTNWTSLGLITRPTPANNSTTAKTRFPVAMAFEESSQSILIAYTNFSLAFDSTCGNFAELCAHEVHTVLLPWNATSATVTGAAFTRWEDPSVPSTVSAAAVGPPAMACGGADGALRNCEIIFVAFYGDRAVGAVRFKASSTGISNRTLPGYLGGYTDDAISYQTTYAGALVAAVSGLNSNVWVASKIGIGGSGFGWQQVSQYLGGPPMVSRKGPLLRARMEPYFDLVVFPN